MRPSAVTAVASENTSPSQPMARLPRCTRCQSFANPSLLEYWHIGETPIRLGRVTPRIGSGSNKWAMFSSRISDNVRFRSDSDIFGTALRLGTLDAFEAGCGAAQYCTVSRSLLSVFHRTTPVCAVQRALAGDGFVALASRRLSAGTLPARCRRYECRRLAPHKHKNEN